MECLLILFTATHIMDLFQGRAEEVKGSGVIYSQTLSKCYLGAAIYCLHFSPVEHYMDVLLIINVQ